MLEVENYELLSLHSVQFRVIVTEHVVFYSEKVLIQSVTIMAQW